jgi:hypothetical protein
MVRGGTIGSKAWPELPRSCEQRRTRVCLLDTAYVVNAPLLGHIDADDDQIARPIEAWIAAISDSDPITRIRQPLFDKSAGLMVFLIDDNVPVVPHVRILGGPGRVAMSGGLPHISIETRAKWARTLPPIGYRQWLLAWWK